MPERQDHRSTRHSVRDRLLLIVLLLIVLSPLALYVAVSFAAAKEMRIRLALDRNLSTAQLAARLLDERPDSSVALVHELNQRRMLSTSPSGIDRTSELRRAVREIPALARLALYDRNGKLLGQYPAGSGSRLAGLPQSWFRGV